MFLVWDELRKDVMRIEKHARPSNSATIRRLIHDAGLRGILLYRMSRYCMMRKIPIVPNVFSQLNVILNGLAIDNHASLGHGVYIPHPVGIVVGATVIVEDDVWIYSGVVLGGNGSTTKQDGNPYIEKGVFIGTGAKILGPVRVGARSRIGANTVVLADVPPDSVVVSAPNRIVAKASADDR